MRDMCGRGEAVSVETALSLLLGSLGETLPAAFAVPLESAYGRICAEDIAAPEDLPPFTRSTVDGYAVSAADTFGATETAPGYLTVAGEIPMGAAPSLRLSRGEAVRIATGGMLPDGADAVLMVEHAQAVDERMVEVQRAVAPGENLIRRGEDVPRGGLIIQRGRRLGAEDVGVLAGLGLTEAVVFDRPRVAILSTGDEIVAPGEPLQPGRVRDMNSYILEGRVFEAGGIPSRRGIVRDDGALLREALGSALECSSLVLVSGGSSVGVRDMTERVISELGAILFHSVALKPGKPTLAGVVGGKPVIGLPGHPRAVSVCFSAFVAPVIERLSGRKPSLADAFVPTIAALLDRAVHSAPGREDRIPVTLERREGELWATPLMAKSGILSTLVRCHGFLTIPPGTLGAERGESVRVELSRYRT
jgi:molybdopterin molybdotransferase